MKLPLRSWMMSADSQSDSRQYAWGFVVDEVFRLVPDKITAGSALKGVLR